MDFDDIHENDLLYYFPTKEYGLVLYKNAEELKILIFHQLIDSPYETYFWVCRKITWKEIGYNVMWQKVA